MKALHPKTAQQALRQARVNERAQDMFTRDGGYVAYDNSLTGVWSVQNPTGTRYAVNLKVWTCDCPDFAEHGDLCKHLVRLSLTAKRKPHSLLCSRRWTTRKRPADVILTPATDATRAEESGKLSSAPHYSRTGKIEQPAGSILPEEEQRCPTSRP